MIPQELFDKWQSGSEYGNAALFVTNAIVLLNKDYFKDNAAKFEDHGTEAFAMVVWLEEEVAWEIWWNGRTKQSAASVIADVYSEARVLMGNDR